MFLQLFFYHLLFRSCVALMTTFLKHVVAIKFKMSSYFSRSSKIFQLKDLTYFRNHPVFVHIFEASQLFSKSSHFIKILYKMKWDSVFILSLFSITDTHDKTHPDSCWLAMEMNFWPPVSYNTSSEYRYLYKRLSWHYLWILSL